MILLLGETGSGKDTVREILKSMGLKTVISYTTRPPREHEVDGVDYHFISASEFKLMIYQGLFAEYEVFNTCTGRHYWGTAIEDCVPNAIKIVEPSGLRQLKSLKGDLVYSILLKSSTPTRLKRLMGRGDRVDEIHRRLKSDEVDFKGIEDMVDLVIENEGSYEELRLKIIDIFGLGLKGGKNNEMFIF